TFEGEIEEAYCPLSVTLTLEDEIDVSRGDMIVRPGNVPKVERKFEATLVWMSEKPLTPGTQYLFKQSTRSAPGVINTLRYQIDVNSLHRKPSATLALNEIGRCSISLNLPLAFDGYRRNKSTGAFIVIDRISNETVAAGMILDTSTSETGRAHWSDEPTTKEVAAVASKVTTEERQARFGQKPVTVLLTGLTGAGKSTTAYMLDRRLFDAGRASTVLDGQNLRRGINRDLGYTSEERSENLRRGAEFAKTLNEAGLICVAAFVAPSEEVRQKAKAVVGESELFIVHLNAPVEVCRERDQDGLYAAADAGEIGNFPGVTAPYEEPEAADLVLATDKLSAEECVDQIWQLLESKGVIE
ncbi:MAG: adenylyl-sulfate kinase, partial [bacterium]|nr:adenylyl-sulfate kinase [bacterium]